MMQYSSEELEDEIKGIITTEQIIQDPVARIEPPPGEWPADQQQNHDPQPAMPFEVWLREVDVQLKS